MAEQHEKALVPQIRFAGFTDPWEQRKLGELFEESDERASDREILSVSVANGYIQRLSPIGKRILGRVSRTTK